jgi:trans-aconitate 2-methyltransferase
MVQPGRGGLASWIESTWLPYIERVPEELRGDFVDVMVECYASTHPLDDDEQVHVKMMRLEVEAEKDRY